MEPEAPFVGLTFIDGTMTTGEVALAVVRKHFLAMLAKRDGTLEGSDPEDLHDMRVATRRIRAATSIFRPFLCEEMLIRRDDFAWLGQALGTVRDLDVQLEHVHGWAQELPGGQADRLVAFMDVLSRRREAARKAMIEALCTERYTALSIDLACLLMHPPEPPSDSPVTVSAPDLIEKRMRSFRKSAAGLKPEDPPEGFHLARIKAKKLRYAMEFLAPVYGKVAKDASLRIFDVQELLGLHQDCVVAIDLVDEVADAEDFPSRTMFCLGMLRQFLEDKAVGLRADFPKVLKESQGKEWRALREAMRGRVPSEEDAEPAQTETPEP